MLNEEWVLIRRDATEIINSTVAEEFRQLCERHFEYVLDGKGPFRRRPNASLRLVCDTPVPTKLVACPCGTARHGEFVPQTDKVYCELLQERTRVVGGKEARKFTRLLTMTVKPDGASLGTIYPSAGEHARIALGVMTDLIADARSVFARSHDRCCCCGRGLRDELSRARGIGPECVRVLDWLAFEKVGSNGLVNAVSGSATGTDSDSKEGSIKGNEKRDYIVRLVREIMAWQHQEVRIEVEAADMEEAERRALQLFEDDDIDHDDWEVMDGGSPYQVLVPPFVGSIEALPQS